jgi:DDE superfamily endonuclease
MAQVLRIYSATEMAAMCKGRSGGVCWWRLRRQCRLGGTPAREDYEYERRGTANLFVWYEPLRSHRHVEVTDRRCQDDWAHCIRDLVDVHYPDAERIVLVLDNLNIHTPASLYVAFEPAEAKRLADKLEIHYTPKHGSWLNMAEIELAILSGQCLDRRIPDMATLSTEVAAWEQTRNETATGGGSAKRVRGSAAGHHRRIVRCDEHGTAQRVDNAA